MSAAEWGAFQLEPRFTEEEIQARRQVRDREEQEVVEPDVNVHHGNRRDRELQDRLDGLYIIIFSLSFPLIYYTYLPSSVCIF